MGISRFPAVVRLLGMLVVAVLVGALLSVLPQAAVPAFANPPSTVALATDKAVFNAGDTFTLTATVDEPLELSSSVLVITDATSSTDIKTCTTGLTCVVSTAFFSGAPRDYVATVGVLQSQTITVSRASWSIVLDVDEEEIGAGELATVTATANQDVSDTNGAYAIAIFDATRQTRVQTCTSGDVCDIEVSAYTDTAGSTDYVAAVIAASDSTSQTVSAAVQVQASSNQVTVERAPWVLTVSVGAEELWPGEDTWVSVTADQSVSDTGGLYSIYLFDMSRDAFFAQCDFGATCSSVVTWLQTDYWGAHFMAVIAERRSSPPASYGDLEGIIGLSDIESISAHQWEIELESSVYELAPGESATLTSTTNMDLSLTSGRYTVYFVDWITSEIVDTCVVGTVCTTTFSFWGPNDDGYSDGAIGAVVGASGAPGDLNTIADWLAADNPPEWTLRSPWVVSLQHTGGRTFTLTSNHDVALTNQWAWYLFYNDGNTIDVTLDKCQSGRRCVLRADQISTGDYFVGLVRDTNPVNAGESVDWITGTGVIFESASPTVGPMLRSPISGRSETTGGRNLAQGVCYCGRADPVNTATGEFYLPELDLGLDGVGPSLAVTRTYSTTGASATGPFGFGWAANFDARLSVLLASDDANPLPRQVEVEQENGSILVFTRDGSSSDYLSPTRVQAELQWSGVQDQWVLIRQQTEILRFDALGQLVVIADRDGNALELDYAAGKLDSISGSGGRWIEFTWDGDLVVEIEDSAGRVVQYDYDVAGDLVSVTATDAAVTEYEYDPAHLMTAFERPGGARTVNVFDEDGRVVAQTDPISRVTTFQYVAYYESMVTTITGPNGVRIVDEYVDNLLIQQTLAEGTAAEAVTQYAYNEHNLVASVVDAVGGLTLYEYDANGNRVQQTDPLNRVTTWTYGAHRSPLTVTDPENRTTIATYDAAGRPLTTTLPEGGKETWTYNPDGTVASHEDANGAVTTYDYDAAGRVIETVDAANDVTTVTYNGYGLPVSTTGPDGATVDTTYDAAGRILQIEDALTNPTIHTYDAAGNLASVTNPEGETTAYTHDAAGQLLTVTDGEAGVTTYTYDLGGNIATRTDPNGNAVSTVHDHYGNLLTSTNALGQTTVYGYDLAGRLLSTKLPSGATTTLLRDLAGQVVKVTDALGEHTVIAYDDAGQPVTLTDPLARVTTTAYDADGRVVSTTFPDASTQAYTYDDAGNVLTFTNADGRQSSYTYTITGLLASRTEPGGLTTEYAYDDAGRVQSVTLPDSSEIDYDYDLAGQLLGVSYPASPAHDAIYAYDDAGRLTSVIDHTGATTLTYDDTGRLLSETDGGGATLGYSYDPGGRLTGIQYPDTRTVTYGYDIADRVVSLTDWSARVSTFAWSVDGQLTGVVTGNGVEQVRSYDAVGRVLGVTTSSGLTELAGFGYAYDAAGQLTGQTSGFAATQLDVEVEHDLLGQLAAVTREDGVSPPVNVPVTVTPAGLLQVADDGAALTYNTAQQVVGRTPVVGPATSFSYDGNGARVSAQTATTPVTVTTFGYDPAGYLAEVVTPLVTVEYETDARGLRQTRDTGTVEQFVWSTARSLPLLLADADHYYLYGPGATPIAQVEQTTDTVTYLHADALGSVRASTDATGVLLGAQSFTEFGTVLWAVGVIGTRFGFTGNWTDPDTGMLHLRARDYDPTTGQFLSVDPALDDTRQPYAYAGNNPIQFTDHTGLDFWADLGTNTLAFGAGLLNGATFGLSGLIMSAVIPGYDCFVETNSGFYTAGDIIGMTATTIAVSAISAGSLGALGVGLRVTTTAATKVLPAAIRTSQQTVVATTRIAAKHGDEVVTRIGKSRTYTDLTKGGSIRNVGTNATHTEFANNLTAGGWVSRTSKDGAVQIFQRDGARYVLRERAESYGGWTADFRPAGAHDVTLKIRLGHMP